MNKKYISLVKDTIIFAIGSLGSKLLLFLLIPLYTNYMSKVEYGIADLIFTIAQLIIPFTSLTIYHSILRFGLSKECKKEDVLLNGLVVVVFGNIISYMLSPIFNLFNITSQWKIYILIYVTLSCFNQVGLNYLKVENKNKLFSIISIIQTFMMAILNIYFLVYLKIGIKGYLLANIIAMFISTVMVYNCGNVLKNAKKGKFNKKLMKNMIAFSAPIIINDISWWIIHSSDKIMIDIMISSSILGMYTVASKIPSLINVIVSIFTQAWGISSIKEIESSDDSSFYSNIFNIYNFLIFGSALLIICLIKIIMKVMVGISFYESWKFVPFLILGSVFAAIASFFGTLYGALKKSSHTMYTTIFSATINVILNYILIRKIGIWGAIIGTVCAYVIMAFVRMYDILKYIKMSIEWKGFILNCCILFVETIVITIELRFNYTVASICIITFIMINYKFLFRMIEEIKKILYKRGVKIVKK